MIIQSLSIALITATIAGYMPDINIEKITKETVNVSAISYNSSAPVYEIDSIEQNYLFSIDNEDPDYEGTKVELSEEDRELLEKIVMSEAGTQGMEGAALVAQTFRDIMIYEEINSIAQIQKDYKYAKNIDTEPNQDVLDAVSYIFDEGKSAVRHKIYFFYAPKRCKSKFHESQNFVIEYMEHRFFSEKDE